MAESLLIELLTEELPPKSLRMLGDAFADLLVSEIAKHRLKDRDPQRTMFATPRRLAVLVPNVRKKALDSSHSIEGPASSNAKAVEGFARKHKVLPESLERRQTDKGEIVVANFTLPGVQLDAVLASIVEGVLGKLPVPKMMRWGDGEAQFVRPVHGLVMLHGAKVVTGTVLGLKSGNKTLGHRFLSKGQIVITHADRYAEILCKSGKVIASFEERRAEIEKQLRHVSKRTKAHVFLPRHWTGDEKTGDTEMVERMLAARSILGANAELLDEVTALVEWPAVYTGEFEQDFLEVPSPCISLTMQKNQKYFALMSEKAELLPKYLLVSNLDTGKPDNIINGNARVLRARLSDARFFYDQDRKTKLETRVPRLGNVVYHNKLGSQLDRVQRIEKLAVAIAGRLKADVRIVERAAHLCKADLLTGMVGEFPELQGQMGYYYARHDGERPEVAKAIARHYLPRFAGDVLPSSPSDMAVALADKLDTLVGIYGIGLQPTGDKDPYGLRRAALGVVRILVEKSLPLDVTDLLQLARALFPNDVVSENVAQDLYGFILDRLRPYLRERGHAPDEIEAVLALNPTRLDQVAPRLEAIRKFRAAPEGQALAAANKRIRNILRQAGDKAGSEVNPALLREDAEKKLAQVVQALHGEVMPLFGAGDYGAALRRLASLRPAVDEFFDKVMVMVDDAPLRENRLALLNGLAGLFLNVGDISRLQS
jgi:glycyl-tRNA synthetase beta chain